MMWVIYGAGAEGGSLGGRLANAGNDVIFIARGPTLTALRSSGPHIPSQVSLRRWTYRTPLGLACIAGEWR